MSTEGHGRFLGQVRAVPEPECGRSEMQYFSMSPEFSLILACLIFPLTDRIPKNLFEVAEGLEFSFSFESSSC
jgi:hypothetical protein